MKHLQNEKRFTRRQHVAQPNMKPDYRLTAPLGILALVLTWIFAAPAARGAAATAHPPERMTYQGYLVDANGAPLGSSEPINTSIIFRIWRVATGSIASNRMWTEQQTVTIDNGYFSVVLGDGNQFEEEAHGNLSAVFSGFDASDRFLGLTIPDIMGANELLPRITLVPSPYAFLARYANGIADDANGEFALTNSASALRISKTIQTMSGNVRGTNAVDLQVGTNDTAVASGDFSVISGGSENTASGNYSSIPGGDLNIAAGDYSFAAGRRAEANHNGVFVWSDSINSNFGSTADNQFLVQANNGVGINTSDLALMAGNALTVNGSAKLTGTLEAGIIKGAFDPDGIAAEAITTTKLADDAVTSAKIANNSVTSANIVNESIVSADIDDGTITAADLAADSVGASEIQTDAVRAAEIQTGAVGTSEVADNSLTAQDLAAGSVTASELATGAVTSTDILNGTIQPEDLIAGLSNLRNNGGKLGINQAWSNWTLNIRSANTTDGLLRIEDSTGRKMLTHDATGKLQLVADTAIIGATGNSGSGSLNIQQRGDVGGTMTDIARMGIDGSGIQTWTNNGSGGWKINDADNVLRLQPYGGRVGIGTDSPTAALNIVQKDTASSIFQAENSAGTGYIRLNKNGRFGYNRTATGVSFLVKGHTGDTTIFRVENDANTALFRVMANGDVFKSGGTVVDSDRRLKKDIESLADVLPRVMNLRPTNYRYNRESSNSPTRIGFIAQEVETEFPTLINRSDSHLALNYEAFGVIAIKAIQEQQALIEAKDARISDLERRLLKQEQAEAAREARLSKLEQRLQRLVASAEDGSKKAQKVSNLTVAQAVR